MAKFKYLEEKVANQTAAIKSKLNAGNAYCRPVQSLSTSHLLSMNFKD